MIRGFLAGSLTLVALYVLVQNSTAGKATEASNALVAGFKRLLDPTIAGVGDHSAGTAGAKPYTIPNGPTQGRSTLPPSAPSAVKGFINL